MKHQIKDVALNELKEGVNTRLTASLDYEGMADSLEDRGMDEPIQAWKTDEGSLEIVRGYRRFNGASILKSRNPKRFKELFPNGIPVIIRKDITNASEAALAKVDHGTVVSLRFRSERDMAVAILKDEGCTEEEICARLEGLFAKFQTAVPSSKREKLAELKKDPVGNRVEIRKLVHETYKGQLQASIAVWKCPPRVAECLRHLEAKEPLPKGVKCPAKLTYGDVKKLAKALEEDCKILDDGGVPKHSKGNPGPNFSRQWAETLKVVKKEGTRAKAMSANAMQEQLDSGAWDSEGFKLLTQQHSGKQDVKGLKAADEKLYLVDLVVKHKPEVWKAFKAQALAIKQGVIEGTL